jgi:hypothetical protein
MGISCLDTLWTQPYIFRRCGHPVDTRKRDPMRTPNLYAGKFPRRSKVPAPTWEGARGQSKLTCKALRSLKPGKTLEDKQAPGLRYVCRPSGVYSQYRYRHPITREWVAKNLGKVAGGNTPSDPQRRPWTTIRGWMGRVGPCPITQIQGRPAFS